MEDVKWIKALLTVITVIIVVYVLRELKAIFLPLVFAVFLSFIFSPLNTFLYRYKIPKFFVIILMMFIIFSAFALVGLVIYAAINSFIIEFPKYQERFVDLVNQTYAQIQEILLRLDLMFDRMPEWLDQRQILSPGDFSVTRLVTGTMGTFVDVLVLLFLTLIFLAFIVAGASKMEKRLRKVLTESGNKRTFYVIDNIR